MQIDRKRLIYFVPVLIVKTKLRGRILNGQITLDQDRFQEKLHNMDITW
jgi:ligand-binding sensor protein